MTSREMMMSRDLMTSRSRAKRKRRKCKRLQRKPLLILYLLLVSPAQADQGKTIIGE